MESKDWGMSASIDLHNCNPNHIRNPEKMRDFVVKLCEEIGMERVGEAIVKRLGKGHIEGYSLFQFIETSNITAHFDETQERAFIDIFSCKFFDAEKAAEFCKDFFGARDFTLKTMRRS